MALSGYSLRLYSFVSILASTGNSMGIVNKHSFGVLFFNERCRNELYTFWGRFQVEETPTEGARVCGEGVLRMSLMSRKKRKGWPMNFAGVSLFVCVCFGIPKRVEGCN